MNTKTVNTIRTVAELEQIIEPEKKYTRQEIAAMVGCIWANVLDASRGDNPKLHGELVTVGKVQTWLFTGSEVLRWRRSVEAHSSKGIKCVITLESTAEIAELKALLKGSKFENRI